MAKKKTQTITKRNDGRMAERLILCAVTLIAPLMAYWLGQHTAEVPIIHDAEGYRLIAKDIEKSGIFSKYYLSELRTYGCPPS